MKTLAQRVLAVIFAIALIAAAGTFIPRPLFIERQEQAAETRRILILSNPIHTDIAIPLADDTRAAFSFLAPFGVPVAEPAAEWLIIGWGGRAFYLETPTWADLKPLPAFRAITLDNSVMHLDVAGGIDEGHASVTPLALGPAEFQHMTDFILASFARKDGGVIVVPDAAYGQYDRFFEANGYFNAFLGCNTWTAAVLRAAGLRTGLWNALPQTLTLSLKFFN
ncbi:TIGR02117 family protein [Rhizobium deserti]|uniref:TIGR02117 family protein n=1 Tax=Rhizobium deserti TaxID=2547961 RepID=A0A4R5UMV4_9HYPH|nr:TIGR02117 family protein [Rhizobium deserti]TDK39181.1 TIGR02117 family protein [Rhizobium deserti]